MIFLFLAFFIFGSIPFGLLMSKIFYRGDIRKVGSGNVGATNVARVAGFWPAGLLTLLFDLLKAGLPLAVLKWNDAIQEALIHQGVVFHSSDFVYWALGFTAIVGHCFSPFLKLKGGKGVATGLGVFLVLSPIAAGAGILAFVVNFFIFRIGSLASLTGVFFATLAHVVLFPVSVNLVFIIGSAWLILCRHDQNLDRLLEHQENAFR